MKVATLKSYLRKSHQKVSHKKRVQILSDELTHHLTSISENSLWNCIDVGCGDMQISTLITSKASNLKFKCIDIYPPSPERSDIDWEKYIQYNGTNIPYESQAFDAAIFVDVLHHCQDISATLAEAKRVAKYIVIKDHLEYGFLSRTVLQLMDFYGNWAYDVSIPKRYFTQDSFLELCQKTGLRIVDMKIGINLYDTLPVIPNIVSPRWQFIAVLESQTIN